jgi:hypothetical protein
MFGSGLYFADMFSKSAGYCNDYTAVDAQPYSLLLLCEVALGQTYDLETAKYMERAEENYLSTKGVGRYGPDPKMQLHDKQGVGILCAISIILFSVTNNFLFISLSYLKVRASKRKRRHLQILTMPSTILRIMNSSSTILLKFE